MRTLLLLRHAKSSWDDPTIGDFDRPLAPRGRRDAPIVGRFLRKSGVDLDHVLCSTAARAKETLALAAKAAKYDGEVEYTDAVYEASHERLARLVRALPEEAQVVLMVGHNPGFEELLRFLCSRGASMNVLMPTAALACIDLDADRWEDAAAGGGTLRWLVVPRILGD